MTTARCPQCGNLIPEYANGVCYRCAGYERKHGGRPMKRPYLRKAGETSAGSLKVFHAANSVQVKHEHQHSRLTGNMDPVEHCRRGVGRLIYAIWGYPTRLSMLLQRNGISDEGIQALGAQLKQLFPALAKAWSLWFHSTLPGPSANLLDYRYSLRGNPPQTLADLKIRFGEPYHQLAGLETGTLNSLRQRAIQLQMEQIATELARSLI